MKPTIDDIARASGVSKGTVSRVLNGHRAVAPGTREKVLGIMTHLGYRPDPAARQLSWRTGHALGLSVLAGDPLLSPYHVLFRRAIERELGPLGLTLDDLGEDFAGLSHWPSAMLVMHVREDDPRLKLLRERGVPTVLVGHHPAWSWVAPDDRGGARQAAQALTDLGHRDLLLVGDGDSQVSRDRKEGFGEGAREAGARVTAIPADFTTLGGYRALRKAWDSTVRNGGARPTGVFAASDEMALGVILALRDLGVEVPREVSVIGFDGLPELAAGGENWAGRLTTVAQDIGHIAREALGLVLEALAGQPPRGVYVPARLKAGETTAPYTGQNSSGQDDSRHHVGGTV